MAVVLALDQGTTSSRAAVFDVRGNLLALDQREFEQIFPEPGRVEHDPLALWQTQYDTAIEALRTSGVHASDVAAVGITNQRETTILWERSTGKAIGNAIVWQDRRTAALCETLKKRGLAALARERTGLLLDPYFSATKLAWLLENVPGLRARAERGDIAFGTVDTWLIWQLTGGRSHVTDVTNASRTLLFDIRKLEWDDELLSAFGIPRSILPDVLPCTADFGMTDKALFGVPLRIAGVAGDQQAALVGQAGFSAGVAKNTYGTGSFVMLNTGEDVVTSAHGLLSTIAFAFEKNKAAYALEGSIFSTGSAVQWLRDGLGIIRHAGEIEALAREAQDNEGVYFVPAFTGLGAPYWDAEARGTIAGITRGTRRPHIARAALEAAAYQCADVLDAMAHDSAIALAELRVDGGGCVNDFTMQFQADVLGVPVVRPRITETTALGAAYLAGLQCGFWNDLQGVADLWQEDARFLPQMSDADRERALREWRRAVSAARG